MGTHSSPPRLVIAGLAGDSGKTAVSLALLRAAVRAGVPAHAFKKGPDYIDPAWLSWASNAPARNLDSWLMGPAGLADSFVRHAVPAGFNLIEGNRGLFDGSDVCGTHSTVELAKILAAPVVLVLTVTKMTRTAAALVLGCLHLDPAVRIAGVILNRVNGRRHEHVVRTAIEETCGIPVVGVVPQLGGEIMPQRHLGLVTPEDYRGYGELDRRLADISSGLDLNRIFQFAHLAGEFPAENTSRASEGSHGKSSNCGCGLKIAYIRDAAFSFYYPDNLEALERTGAQLIKLSSFTDRDLPHDIDALYVGGGFPEVHAARISENSPFLRSLKDAAEAGLPIYAECGGLMLLARSIVCGGVKYPMADVFDVDVEIRKAPQGHGYAELLVDRENPFFTVGTVLRGHEFHYSRLAMGNEPDNTTCSVLRGVGLSHGRDVLLRKNIWAGYTHLHAAATPEWADGMISAARRFHDNSTLVTPAPLLPHVHDSADAGGK